MRCLLALAASQAKLSYKDADLIANTGISWREESFGALCYNFATRDLFLIKSAVVVAVLKEFSRATSRSAAIESLAGTGCKASVVDAAIDALCNKGVLINCEHVPKSTDLG